MAFKFIGEDDRKEFEESLKLSWQAYAIKEVYKQQLKDIIEQVLKGGVGPPASIDVLMNTIMTSINLFAYLWAGTDKEQSKMAIEFIRTYLGKVEVKYR